MAPGVQEEGEEARGLGQSCILGCTIKATSFYTTTNPSPLSPCLGLSPGRPRAMSVHWASGLEHNLAHGESKSEELLLVQEGGLTLSRQVLMPRPSPPHSGSLRDAQCPITKQQHF